VYKNGLRLKGGGIDYTAGASSFTTVVAPATGAILLVDYEVGSSNFSVGSNSIIVGEVPTGLVNSSNTVYTTTRAYIGGSVEIMVNGVAQARTTHFTETTPSTGIITMSDAPLTGDIITVNYQFNLNPASNSDTVDGIHASATPVANQLLALDGNAKLGANYLYNPYKFSVNRAAAWTTAAAASIVVPFDTKEFDTSLNIDVTTNKGRFTAPITGFYQFNVSVSITAGVTRMAIFISKNGIANEVKRLFDTNTAATNIPTGSGSTQIQLTAGDFIEVGIYTSAVVSGGITLVTYFSGFLVSAL